ncbi:MAG: hypothetical protein HFJ49_03070 [Clostridia bacterium]|jgi:Skp family chaperone for outer membrane proteins|nr:hypothetical protein [Clostridia bacterium]
MEKDIRTKIFELGNQLTSIIWDAEEAQRDLQELENKLSEENENSIKDINNLKRELKRDNLYTDELENFLDNYMRYYNK